MYIYILLILILIMIIALNSCEDLTMSQWGIPKWGSYPGVAPTTVRP